jgi:c(7)-type cytochrome triheme protein
MLPVLLVAVAVAFVVYRSPSFAEGGPGNAEEISISSGAQYGVASEDEYGVPDDISYTKPVESVTFSHQTHAVDLGYKCDVCHKNLFQMKANNVESRPDFNMKGLAEGKYCGSCHSAGNNPAFSSSSQCARCHSGVKGLEELETESKAGNS